MLYAFYYMLLFVKTCDFFCLTSVFVLTIRYFIMYNVSFLFFPVSIKFYSWDLLFYHVLLDAIDIFQWRRQIGNFNNRSSFSKCTIFLDFSIMSLSKLLIKFLCCIMSLVLILLLHILHSYFTTITFCKFVICIYSRHILYFSLLANYLCQFWLCKLHINLSGDI